MFVKPNALLSNMFKINGIAVLRKTLLLENSKMTVRDRHPLQLYLLK